MIILPLHKKPSRQNLPLVTLGLLLVNLFIFFALQAGDRAAETEAARFYNDSGLSEQEWTWYSDFLSPSDQPHWDWKRELDALAERGAPAPALAGLRARVVRAHPDFLDQARQGRFLDRDSEAWREWSEKRQAFESQLDESFSHRFMLTHRDVDAAPLLLHMFMHGSVMHLVGNMLFLVLLGLLVEGALGARLYLGAYLLAGLAAAGASLLVNWGNPGGMLGASGAIAGLMGLYAVLYGRRRVRFFYWFFVYFDYVRAPAIVLLPAWLGWEVLQFFLTENNVAYEAHIGGIVAGALSAAVIRRMGWQDDEFLEEDSRAEQDRTALKHAREAISALRPAEARTALRPLLERHGRDPDVLRTWYAASKLQADDPERHEAAARILALPGEDPETRALIVDTLRDYRGRGRIRLRPSLLCRLAGRLSRWGELEEAQRLVTALLRLKKPPRELANTCLLLARALIHRQAGDAALPFIDAAERLAEHPEEKRAARLLRPE